MCQPWKSGGGGGGGGETDKHIDIMTGGQTTREVLNKMCKGRKPKNETRKSDDGGDINNTITFPLKEITHFNSGKAKWQRP